MDSRTLRDLCQDLPDARFVGDAAVPVGAVRSDSRAVKDGDVFVAVRGLTSDGHDFVTDALENGARALIVEDQVAASVAQVTVPDTVEALGWLAARQHGRPADDLVVVGVTGTNGKTTCSYILESLLAAAGQRPGVIGTVSYRFAGTEEAAPYTTPVPEVLHEVVARMRDAECSHLVMEASSIALHMRRLAGLRVNVAAFTNFTQDHLDIHGSMDAYFAAKTLLFRDHLAPDGTAVALVDDPDGRGQQMLDCAPASARRLRVSLLDEGADVFVERARSTVAGIEATLRTPRGDLDVETSALFGEHNVQNLAVCVAVGEALGLEHAAIASALAALGAVPGRLERVRNAAGLDVFVDYAHTPDALENVLAALRPVTKKRLIVVFGCGGDRDRDKRPVMGQVAARGADVVIVTSDNPRTEDPASIVGMIYQGVAELPGTSPVLEVDRRRAIGLAIAMTQAGDVVLIAGKGHEDYQIVGTTKQHFDDREEAARALQSSTPRPQLKLADVIAATGGGLVSEGTSEFTGVTIDSRTTRPGDLYFAIVGERFDGHDFCSRAIEAGAAGVVTARGHGVRNGATCIEVDDTRDALARVAGHHRQQLATRVVGVTGSSGKTTTKALIASMLSEGRGPERVSAQQGSFNNETGVPLSLLALRDSHDFAVIEMGMRQVGDIDHLARFVRPDVAVVTNAQAAHLGVAGSVDNIARGKSEIFRHGTEGAFVVYPRADSRLERFALAAVPDRAQHVTFGVDPEADVRIAHVRARGAEGTDVDLHLPGGAELTCHVPLPGRHNVENAACAIAVAVALGIDLERAARGLARTRAVANRSEVRELGGRHLLADYYNANPASMRAAISTLDDLAGDRGRVAVLGDMLELGPTEEDEHEKLGEVLAAARVDSVIALGDLGPVIARGAREAGLSRIEVTDDPAQAARVLADWTQAGDWVLVKASRGVRLERVVDAFLTLTSAGETP